MPGTSRKLIPALPRLPTQTDGARAGLRERMHALPAHTVQGIKADVFPCGESCGKRQACVSECTLYLHTQYRGCRLTFLHMEKAVAKGRPA
eukprot:1158556-Pelagomonas_calceolata.AAC.8